MLSMLPVERSSMTKTSSPRLRYASLRCEPMKPAPPVIRIRKPVSVSRFLSKAKLVYHAPDFTGGLPGPPAKQRQRFRRRSTPDRVRRCPKRVVLSNDAVEQTRGRVYPTRGAKLHLR